MGEVEFVGGDGWISDDSSFYGDEDSKQQLEQISTQCNVSQKNNLNTLIEKSKTRSKKMEQLELSHPGQGRHDSWHLFESAEEFVKRVPPLTTSIQICDWIWVHKPNLNPHGAMSAPSNEMRLMSCGQELLASSIAKRSEIKSGKVKQMVTKQLNVEAKLLEQQITDLAVEMNVLHGKWMLFPEVDAVTRVWRVIVDAVINGKLGPTAKVAPDDGTNKARLICIYTNDFRDKEDVLRVLRQLVSLGVVNPQRNIYYKTDVNTILGIYGGTASNYGLQASLYSSQKMLADAQVHQSNATASSQAGPHFKKRKISS
ncbi:DUF1917-domain-containing protein [Periconia macrospinosa]|uniref:DUF1917-domain-containing protein n=1 Tax=Periconia macrospinosa TaxID=97972 RepID=A0A2V1DA20_9PLEO|nr:DUF1917-domain-containing protein [Periconia macrospinosa]